VSADEETKEPKLASRVERVLAEARAAAKADHARKEGRWLAVFPITVGALLLLLLMPRASAPEAVPLPRVDARVVAAIERADDARARSAEVERLPGYALAVGTALRALNALDAKGGDELARIDGRRRLASAVGDVPAVPEADAALLTLRGLQVRRFVDALAHWEATGDSNDDLVELGGAFVDRTREAGWIGEGRQILMDEMARRVAFKVMWNALVGVDRRPSFALSLDEERALYGFYIQHPRPAEAQRMSLASELERATTPEECARARADRDRLLETWRIDKIRKLGAIDPSYPTAYALGVAYYRLGRHDLATEAFSSFLAAHPDGSYSLRAKNHLKAALAGGARF
jgi:hypothetical protein